MCDGAAGDGRSGGRSVGRTVGRTDGQVYGTVSVRGGKAPPRPSQPQRDVLMRRGSATPHDDVFVCLDIPFPCIKKLLQSVTKRVNQTLSQKPLLELGMVAQRVPSRKNLKRHIHLRQLMPNGRRLAAIENQSTIAAHQKRAVRQSMRRSTKKMMTC